MPPQPRPRDVPGYAHALANGVIRPVPPDPPSLLPGTTAKTMATQLAVAGGVGMVLFFVVASASDHAFSGDPGRRALVLGLSSLAVLVGIMLMLARVGRRNIEEFAQGYTTLQVNFGMFWPSAKLRSPQQRRIPWDYSGLWVLDNAGRVVSAPTPNVDPPGYYPSPTRPDRLELWTGKQWSGRYRRIPH